MNRDTVEKSAAPRGPDVVTQELDLDDPIVRERAEGQYDHDV
jgi:hypothetical protein